MSIIGMIFQLPSMVTNLTVFIILFCALLIVIFMIECYLKKKLLKKSELLNDFANDNNNNDLYSIGKKAPSPITFPIIGNLLSLAGYEIPYQAFGVLEKRFGPIINLQLGTQAACVVNGIDNIKEVLISKSSHFDSRPNFRRYHDLFSGNKENSLAFCNWSDVQKMRRDMLVQHSFPRNYSIRFNELNNIIDTHIDQMVLNVNNVITNNNVNTIEIKPMLLSTCANIFTEYFCSRSFGNDHQGFNKMISNFDKIFYEVNQGYLADFLPFLLPIFHSRNLKQMEKWSHEIRQFILNQIIENRKEMENIQNKSNMDYVDSLINHVNNNMEPKMEWDTALFALEDIIGGHSAVGNFLVKVFGYIVQNPNVQTEMYNEIQTILQDQSNDMLNNNDGKQRSIQLTDRCNMPYTDAVILEALRLIASPIVPHVANQNSTVGGYAVEKDTMLFLNNYDLSMSEELWERPNEFNPSRFLKDGRVIKPDHFLPFGGGRRSCMGYKMVQFISFAILTNTIKNYEITPINGQSISVEAGSLAVASDKSYRFNFTMRK